VCAAYTRFCAHCADPYEERRYNTDNTVFICPSEQNRRYGVESGERQASDVARGLSEGHEHVSHESDFILILLRKVTEKI